MRIRTVLTLIALYEVLAGFQCGKDCNISVAFPFSLSGWDIGLLDNSGVEPVLDQDGQLPAAAFGLQISSRPVWSSAVDTAGAECLYLYPDTPLASIIITTLTDFDDLHPAGSDISAYWVVRSPDQAVQYRPLSWMLTRFNTDWPDPVITSDLLLLTPPAAPGTFQFFVTFSRHDSSTVLLSSPPVQLQ